MNTCPYFKKEMLDKTPKEEANKLVKKHGIKGEFCNPGGRELIFSFGSIQISDYCNHCDFEKIKKEIKELTEL